MTRSNKRMAKRGLTPPRRGQVDRNGSGDGSGATGAAQRETVLLGGSAQFGSNGYRLQPGAENSVLFVVPQPVGPGDARAAELRVAAASSGKAVLWLCRHGDGQFEGTSATVQVGPSQPEAIAQLNHVFDGAHGAWRLQCIWEGDEVADLSVEYLVG